MSTRKSAEATPDLEIVFDPALGARVARYVSLAFFTWREFPQAFARMVTTREFGLLAGIPVLILLAAQFVPARLDGIDGVAISQGMTALAVLWLLASLARMASFGRSTGIGCYALRDGAKPRLVGGLRLRAEQKARRIWIAGVHVEAGLRGAGIATALIAAAFRLARQEAATGPLTVSVFAPTHPASKAIVERYFSGMQDVPVTEPLAEASRRIIEALEAKAEGLAFKWKLDPAARLFAR